MKRRSCMYLDEKQIAQGVADLSKENEYITETAGFVPLEVKLKQFEENGYIAQFQSGDFTSADMREAYLSPDFEITPEDEFEEIQEKLNARKSFLDSVKAAKSDGVNAEARTAEPEEKKAADAAEEVKPEE